MSDGEIPQFVRLVQRNIAFEQAAIGMALVDFDGAFLAVNPALCKLVGRSMEDLLEITWQSITHPDDVVPGEQGVVKAITGQERTFRLRKRYIRPDGTAVWGLLSVSLICSGLGEPLCLLTQVVDITEQRKAEQEHARLASIVESSDDAILSKDLNGTILTWNRAAERMYGYTATEMIGRHVSAIMPIDRHEEDEHLLERVRRGGSVRNLETEGLRKDSSRIDVSVTLSPILDHAGAVVRTSSIARDITAQKRMAAELERTLAALEVALGEARAGEARTRKFLSDAAHHLRNPVAGISACAETLLRGADPPGSEQVLVEIARESAHVGRLVDRLLGMARLEQGEPLHLESCDVVDVCRDEVERAQSLAPHLEVALTADEPVVGYVDPQALREIVGNLLENTRRHAVRNVDVNVSEREGAVLVKVLDDGPGLPDGAETQAFEPFVSLDTHGGSGLGLALAKALARAHGGDLSYQQRSFVVHLGPTP